MSVIRILIADDHKLMREGIAAMLSKEERLELVGEAKTGREAIAMAEELKPDLVVMDVGMPDINGVEATRTIRSRIPSCKVLALSMHTEPHFVHDMLRAGASGYLPKDSAFDELAKAIRAIHGGQGYLSQSISGLFPNSISLSTEEAQGLTLRENEVLKMLAAGKSSKEIAGILNLSVNTILRHRQNIMDKLELFSIAELTKYAIREKLIAP
ncbi:MAG: hypothetical protein A2X49_15570 [Lentisphaerae bacterium GWF2_52_8]|nr:MAG: hypothetical protein A2X49_15570 [Lentisphaerae bacterium GWF2_52_8]